MKTKMLWLRECLATISLIFCLDLKNEKNKRQKNCGKKLKIVVDTKL